MTTKMSFKRLNDRFALIVGFASLIAFANGIQMTSNQFQAFLLIFLLTKNITKAHIESTQCDTIIKIIITPITVRQL